MSELDETLALAVRLARAAGAVQRERYETVLHIATKSAAVDLVTEVDRRCEDLIVEALRRERPADAILAEEGSNREAAGADWRWVIDPLDGTVNYAHGYPRFCVSIGVEHRGARAAGAIFDPLLEELYTAVRGGGAFRNGTPIRVSRETDLAKGLFATGFAYDVHRSTEDNLDHFARFVKRARAVRRDGSAALDLCYVASGRLDGYWELKLHPWDLCAGTLLVEEAGGVVTDLSGAKLALDGRSVVSSNGGVHAAMLALLAEGPRA